MAVELGAGYVSLSVRYAQGMKDAAKGIEKSAADTGKRAGKKLGTELGKGVQKSGTRYIEGVEDLIAKREKDRAAEAARKDEQRTKRRIEHEERVTGYARREEERRAETAKKKADEVAERQKKKAEEVATTQKRQADQVAAKQKTAWGEVMDEVRARGKEMGIDVDKELSNAAARAGKNIGDAIAGSPIGQKVIGAFETARGGIERLGEQTGIDFGRVFTDALSGNLDSEAIFRDLMSESGVLGGIAGGDFAKSFNEILTQMPGMDEVLKNFPGAAGNKGGQAGEAFSKAFEGVTVTAMLKIVTELESMVDDLVAKVPEKFAGLPTRQLAEQTKQDVSRYMVAGPGAPLISLAERLPGPQQRIMQRSREWWKQNRPSFIPSFGFQQGGRITGPGTSTSDSILARVSTGEGIVNARAMDAGGDKIVAALNKGWVINPNRSLPGFQRGGQVGGDGQKVRQLVGIPYQMGGFSLSNIDCSGLVAAVVNTFMGRPMFESRMSTVTEGSWLSGFGAQRGRGGANDLTLLWWDQGGGEFGHTMAILPGGIPIESRGPTGSPSVMGSAATSPNHSQWTNAMHFTQSQLLGSLTPQVRGAAGARPPSMGRAGARGGGGGGGARGGGGRGGGGGAGGGGGGGGGVPIMPGPGGTWTSPSPAWAALIQRESGGVADIVQGIEDVNSATGNLAEGLFQITPTTWAGAGGTEFAPSAKFATPEQQAEIAARIFKTGGGRDWGAGLPGRENADELAAGLSDTTGYVGDFGDEIQTKTSDLGAFDTSLTGAADTMGGLAPGGQAAGGAEQAFDAMGELGDIAMGGVKETLLPPGFSDPTEWPVVKSIGAFMGFLGGKIGGPGGAVLSAGGAGIMGSPSGAISALKAIMPQGYGQLEPAGPAMRPEEFSAMSTGAGASLAEGFVDAAQGFIPDVQQPQQIDNSIHVGENGTVGQDPTAVRDGIRRDQRTQDRAYATTMRGMPGP